MDNYDKLFDLLKIRYKDHPDPSHNAYVYLATIGKYHIPDRELAHHLESVEKAIIIDALKA